MPELRFLGRTLPVSHRHVAWKPKPGSSRGLWSQLVPSPPALSWHQQSPAFCDHLVTRQSHVLHLPGHKARPRSAVLFRLLSRCGAACSFSMLLFSVSFLLDSSHHLGSVLKSPTESGVGGVETTVSQLYVLLEPLHFLLPLIDASRQNIYTCGLSFSLPTRSSGPCQVGSWAINQTKQLVLRSFLFPCLPSSHLSCSLSLLGWFIQKSESFLGFTNTRLSWSPLSSLTANLLSFFVALSILLKLINIKIPKVHSWILFSPSIFYSCQKRFPSLDLSSEL